jgi:hypothetical protein
MESSNKIPTLPIEMWIEIFHCLDLNSVIQLSQVCKRCYVAAKTDSIWKKLCEQWSYPEKPQNFETWQIFFQKGF